MTKVLQVKECLSSEIEGFRRLLKVMEEEKRILLEGRHGDLQENCDFKLRLSRELETQQQVRRDLMLELSPDKNAPLKLSDLAPMLPQEEQAQFRENLQKAYALAARLEELNQRNKEFLEEALNTVEDLLNILSGVNASPSYNAQGNVQDAPPKFSRFVAKEV